MHIASSQPQFLDIESVDPGALERERDILSEQARTSGKPEEIVSKMVEGRIRKYYEEVVLLEQVFIMDTDSNVGTFVEASAAEIGSPIKIVGFERFMVGEGVERKEDDFADEVAKLAG